MYIMKKKTAETNLLLPMIACILLVITDQLTKWLTLERLKPIGQIVMIDDFFFLTYVENRGAAFGFLQGGRWFFIAITVLIVFIAIFYYIKESCKPLRVSVVMIISGAVGNFIDRLYRGFVVDMLHFRFFGNYDFAVFNFADMLVVCGTILLAVSILFFQKEDKGEEE